MSELLNDVIDYIIRNNLATKKDTDIFKDYSPENPNDCIIVYEYTGTAPAMFTDMSARSVQITVRSKQNSVAKSKSWALYKIFHMEDLNIILGTRHCLIEVRNSPIKIDTDKLRRNIWAFNMAITTTSDL